MFEVGKKYRRNNSANYICIAIYGKRGWLTLDVFGSEPYSQDYDASWREHIEPKVVKDRRFILTDGKRLSIDIQKAESYHGWSDLGEIELTYTEGQGLAVAIVG